MPIPALRFKNVTKTFARSPALQAVAFAVEAGQSFALVGMNGAGKTTLIKSLLDFCDIDDGQIEIFGVSHRLRQARERLTFLPERFTPPYYLTGRDFLQYMLELYRLDFDAGAVEALFRELDLDPAALKKLVRAYSKGMAQKLGLAACFLSARDLYVMDEPMSGLDPQARALLKAQLSALKANGRTLFFSSHTLADVEDLCDRLAVLHQGKLYFLGTPEECCRKFHAQSLAQAYLACIKTPPANAL